MKDDTFTKQIEKLLADGKLEKKAGKQEQLTEEDIKERQECINSMTNWKF